MKINKMNIHLNYFNTPILSGYIQGFLFPPYSKGLCHCSFQNQSQDDSQSKTIQGEAPLTEAQIRENTDGLN